MTVYGATYTAKEYNFNDVFIGVQDQKYQVDVQKKEQKGSYDAAMMLTSSNCPQAQTAFRVRDKASNTVMSQDIYYLYGTNNSVYCFEYRSQWINGTYDVILEAWPTSGYSCYKVSGIWSPDGV